MTKTYVLQYTCGADSWHNLDAEFNRADKNPAVYLSEQDVNDAQVRYHKAFGNVWPTRIVEA